MIRFLVLVILQVLIIREFKLTTYIIPMPYVLFIIMLPFEIAPILLLVLSFILGLSIDMFYDTQGMNAAACVLMAYLRPHVLKFFSPREGYETAHQPTVYYMGYAWFLSYSIPLVIAHHFLLFTLQTLGSTSYLQLSLKIILSSAATLILIYLIQFFTRRKN